MRNAAAISALFCLLLLGCTVSNVDTDVSPDTRVGSGSTNVSTPTRTMTVAMTLAPLTKAILTGSNAFRYYESGVMEFGPVDAPNVLVVVTEYHCPYCKDFERDYMPALQTDILETGKVRIMVIPKHLKKYPNGADAIKGMICAGKQGKAREMHRILFERTNKHRSSVLEYAGELELNMQTFEACMNGDEAKARIDRLNETLSGLNITLVPTFFMNDHRQTGLPSYADLRGWIKSSMR